MRTRNGKIARLPLEIREQINRRLERCEPAPKLLPWLNALPEVQELLRDEFEGEPISSQNLSQWRRGGFRDWLYRMDMQAGLVNAAELATALPEGSETEMADNVATVLVARFAELLTRWDGKHSPEFEARSRVLNGVCRSVACLQRQSHLAERNAYDLAHSREEDQKKDERQDRFSKIQRVFDLFKVQSLAKDLGGGTLGVKLAKYIIALRAGKMDSPDLDWDIEPGDHFKSGPTIKQSETAKNQSQSKPSTS
jgi:hypothetical protein